MYKEAKVGNLPELRQQILILLNK